MYTKSTLRNGNTKLSNSRRTQYCIFDHRKNQISFIYKVPMIAVKQFEKEMRRKK